MFNPAFCVLTARIDACGRGRGRWGEPSGTIDAYGDTNGVRNLDQKVGLKPTVARRGPSSRQGPERLAGRLHPRPAPTRAQRRRAHGSLHPMAARAAAGREAVTECAARADETTGRISADSAQPHPPPAPHPRPAAASPPSIPQPPPRAPPGIPRAPRHLAGRGGIPHRRLTGGRPSQNKC